MELSRRLSQLEKGISFLMGELAAREGVIQERSEGIEWLRGVVRDKEMTIAELERGVAWLRKEISEREITSRHFDRSPRLLENCRPEVAPPLAKAPSYRATAFRTGIGTPAIRARRVSLRATPSRRMDGRCCAHIEDRQDVGMQKRRNRVRFALEPRQRFWIGRRGGSNDLDCDVTIQTRVAGAIDLAHAARSERRQDRVRPKRLPCNVIGAKL